MGGCVCVRSSSIEELLNSFWVKLPIRAKEIKDVTELIKAKKGSIKPIQEKKWLLLQDVLFVLVDFKENCLAIFDEALKQAREKNNEGIFFLSILFLCKSNTSADFKVNFLSLAKTICGIKDDLKTEENDKKNRINYSILYDIISFYVNMITLLPAKHLTTFADGDKDFESSVSKLFTVEKQKEVIDEYIMKKYASEGEWIDYDKFFDEQLSLLKDDEAIRGYFYASTTLVKK